ncbi:AAA family ATPase [Vibrio fluvialis]|nr:AAA family ATPase [Vibrio fluvialis]
MKISKIYVKNFKKISELDISIPQDNRVICFVGENGSNKSSLLSVLYSNLRKTSSISSPSDAEDIYRDNLNQVSRDVEEGALFSLISTSFSQNELSTQFHRAIVPSPDSLSEESRATLIATFGQYYDQSKQFLSRATNHTRIDRFDPDLIKMNVVLFRPYSRFESPLWEQSNQKVSHEVVTTPSRTLGQRQFPMRVVSGLEETNSYFMDVLLDEMISRNTDKSSTSLYKSFFHTLRAVEPSIKEGFSVTPFPDKRISFTNVPALGALSAGQSDWFVTAINILIQMADIAAINRISKEELRDIGGIVFIDEMDMNYHPSFQEKVLPWFLDYFPNIQFVITTHSPYLIRSLGENSIVVKLPSGEVLEDDFSYYDISEVALKVFGQDQGFSPSVQKKINYLKDALSKKDNKRALFLRKSLIGKSDSLSREIERLCFMMGDSDFIEVINEEG